MLKMFKPLIYMDIKYVLRPGLIKEKTTDVHYIFI